MSSFADARSRTRRCIGVALLASALLPVAGCYESHLCGTAETCNYRDDDCDGIFDEGFVDDRGRYTTLEHCGGCGVDCREVFPSASETECVVADDALARCRIVACAEGFHLAGDGACVPDVPVLCLPCTTDEDCALRVPEARCIETASGEGRCGEPCGEGEGGAGACPRGFSCELGQCAPDSGWCACSDETVDVELACIIRRDTDGHACAGVQRCGPDGPGACEPALEEACNAQDDDCDGATDEDFRDDEGRYVARLHCGGCAMPCVEPGPNMIAQCLPDGPVPAVRCDIQCEEGFVDVDRILANGCECERWDGTGPPPDVGGDLDCDGIPDDVTDFVFVTSTGNDADPGTLLRPMRTIQAALERGRTQSKDVLVARGVYDGPFDVVAGVSIYGGYSPDFRDRDLDLYPVLVERRGATPGTPAITCHGVRAPTRVEGFEVAGTDATAPGEGSTTIYLDGCGPEVRLASITVFAARGSDGARGSDSSDNLAPWGLRSLEDLDGVVGGEGRPGTTDPGFCTTVAAGAGGGKTCPTRDVGGGAGGAAGCPESGCVNGSPCGNAGCTDFTVGGVCDFAAVLRAAVPNAAAGVGRGIAGGAAGELTYNAPTNRTVCNFCDDNPTLPRTGGNGADGAAGADGTAGAGCGGALSLDATSGRVSGGGGTSAAPGIDGSGGGGATAGGGYDVIGSTEPGCNDRSGGSGGGGGSGGCGAPGATAGGGGGASIGVVVRIASGLTAGPTMEEVRVVTASAGRGGDGGIGAEGGSGGSGGNGGAGRFWCARSGGRGGDGGQGGAGGGGGGGCGGGTHGIYIAAAGADVGAYRTALLAVVAIDATGVAGHGGAGGYSPGRAGTNGRDGSSDPVFVGP